MIFQSALLYLAAVHRIFIQSQVASDYYIIELVYFARANELHELIYRSVHSCQFKFILHDGSCKLVGLRNSQKLEFLEEKKFRFSRNSKKQGHSNVLWYVGQDKRHETLMMGNFPKPKSPIL